MTEKQMQKMIEKAQAKAQTLYNMGLRSNSEVMQKAILNWQEMLMVYYNMDYISMTRDEAESILKIKGEEYEPLIEVESKHYDYY